MSGDHGPRDVLSGVTRQEALQVLVVGPMHLYLCLSFGTIKGPTQRTTSLLVVTSISHQIYSEKHLVKRSHRPETSTDLSTKPLAVFTKAKSLSNYLVKSSTRARPPPQASTNATLIHTPLKKRVHPCQHPLCLCCAQFFETNNLNGILLSQHLNCCSKNVIYLLKCKQYPCHTYVGQTDQQLNERLRGH